MTTTVSDHQDIRSRLTTAVQWQPARNSLKYGAHLAARARAHLLEARGTMPEVANIFAGSCPKAGSQWSKALFHHPIVRAHTGLFTLPQLAYHQRNVARFPGGTFVPGLYVSYAFYQRIPKPRSHRMVYVFRDPRDIVVSAYFSGMKSHRVILDLASHREFLQGMPIEDGLLYIIKNAETYFRDMASWVGVPDENVASWRLEDIGADPAGTVGGILAHCGIVLSEAELDTVLAETSREALQRKDLANREAGAQSHYRVHQQGFRDLFGPQHYAAIEKVVPGLIERLGYPPS